MKKLIIIILTLITSSIFAQSNLQDVVYLKNGSVIRGTVIEQIPNVSIKIQTTDRNVFVFKMEEILKFSKEEIIDKRQNNSNNKNFTPGYKGILETGFSVGVGNFRNDRLKINFINGIQISPVFSVGLGTGINLYDYNDLLLIPVYADFRINFLDKDISPYVSLAAGYSFNASERFLGEGLLVNPAIGASFKVSDKSAINFSLGYELQKFDYFNIVYISNNYKVYHSKENYGAISINLGFSF